MLRWVFAAKATSMMLFLAVMLGLVGLASQPRADLPMVVFQTEKGTIEMEVDSVRAPVSAANFLKYVEAGFYDGGSVNRSVRADNTVRRDVEIQVIQFQIDPARRSEQFSPIPLERTSVTGLRHVDGVLSMARTGPDTATASFSIVIGDQPEMDFGGRRNPDGQGFAVFGRVIRGMDVVKEIQASPTGASGPYGTESLTPPIKIGKAYRQQSGREPNSADARLRALYTEEWNWRRKELARGGDQPGDAADHFPKVDAASQRARLEYWTKTLATLDSIPFDELSSEEKVNAQIFRTAILALASDQKFQTYEAPFNSDTFFWTDFTPRQGFPTLAAYRAYLGRLRDVPRYFDEQIANMRAGLARGYSVPRVSVVGRDKTIEPYVKGDATNPLYAPFAQLPAGISPADQAARRTEIGLADACFAALPSASCT
jgi:cyclophilin family peptidyl-prolyl cis-trans isomerase